MKDDSGKCPEYKRSMDAAHPMLVLTGLVLGWVGRGWAGKRKARTAQQQPAGDLADPAMAQAQAEAQLAQVAAAAGQTVEEFRAAVARQMGMGQPIDDMGVPSAWIEQWHSTRDF